MVSPGAGSPNLQTRGRWCPATNRLPYAKPSHPSSMNPSTVWVPQECQRLRPANRLPQFGLTQRSEVSTSIDEVKSL